MKKQKLNFEDTELLLANKNLPFKMPKEFHKLLQEELDNYHTLEKECEKLSKSKPEITAYSAIYDKLNNMHFSSPLQEKVRITFHNFKFIYELSHQFLPLDKIKKVESKYVPEPKLVQDADYEMYEPEFKHL